MKQRHALLKLVGDEAVAFGHAPIPPKVLEAKGAPEGSKVVRRYHDVSSGVQSVAIVLSHPSFAEVEDGAQIPELKAKPVAAEEKHAQKTHPHSEAKKK